MALAVRMTAGEHSDFAVGMHSHAGTFPAAVQATTLGEIAAWPRAGLVDEGGKPDPHQYAAAAELTLLAPQPRIVGERQQTIEQRRRIAGLIDAPTRGCI